MVGKVTSSQKPSASVLPAIMGYSPYDTPLTILNRAIQCVDQGVDRLPEDLPQSLPAAVGDFMEDFILDKSAIRLGVANLVTDHPDPYHYQELLSCSLDGTAEGGGLVIKHDPSQGIYVMSEDNEIELIGTGVVEAKSTRIPPQDAPDLFRGPIQLQGQLLCTGHSWGAVCTMYQGSELRIFLYRRDENVINDIIKSCSDFLRRVETRDLYPALSPTEAVRKYPEPMFPKKVITATEALQADINQLAHIRSELKAYQQLAEDLQLDIMNTMQDASECLAGAYRVVWPVRNIKAKPEQVKTIPAVEAHQQRSKVLKIEDLKGK